MSIKAIPLLVFSLILYNVIAFLGGGSVENPIEIFQSKLFGIPMPMGGKWEFYLGDLIIIISLLLLGIEVIKATYTRGAGLADQALSMILAVICIIEFILVPKAATSIFFMIMMMTIIDVIAGAIIGIRTARRDFGIGGDLG